ncbi:hypothetical protein C8A01DRAFT_41367 [Parachaetomium inaequale]|uniref:Uncharacterized protein n=1 Tax=Parachaetomium inaequale TaxID=2588326 RepID=A0AAN6P5W3_9PEZI|nr:hypothetical protein C8A01DRAFT_41367 [Parachaetomium inaequale]
MPNLPTEAAEMTIKQVAAHLNGMFPTDDSLLDALPAGRTFVSAKHSAKSAWTITGKLTARNADEAEELYFVKERAVPQGKPS